MDYGNIDEQLARLHPDIKQAAERFVLLKIGDMRGLDLGLFDFDYDLSWAALMFEPGGNVLGRFGGGDAGSPEKYHSLKGLRYSLDQAWAEFERAAPAKPKSIRSGKKVEDYAGAQRFSPKACFHCHNVHEFRREERIAAGIWTKELEWVYPEPANLGLTLEADQGNKVRLVGPGSFAAAAGIQAGDVLRRIDGRSIASIADLQYALHHAPETARITMAWQRGTKNLEANIHLPSGWRQSDISWRWSLKSLKPMPQVQGEDLSPAERAALGLTERRLALRQSGFVPLAAQQAGIRIGDVIVGVDGKHLDMTARQFETYMRLNYQVGDVVQYDVIRGGERLRVAVKLPG
jgi:hypothetical protein